MFGFFTYFPYFTVVEEKDEDEVVVCRWPSTCGCHLRNLIEKLNYIMEEELVQVKEVEENLDERIQNELRSMLEVRGLL